MKKDRFLLGILVFILLLVAAALVLYFSGRTTLTYLPEETPEAIVHNYALALTNGDFDKAYGYLASGETKPSAAEFRRIFTQINQTQNAGLRVGASEIVDEQAIVQVTILWGSTGPFDSGYSSQESAILVQEGGAWKIQRVPYPFWDFSWYSEPVVPSK